jgi:hypothetical protein
MRSVSSMRSLTRSSGMGVAAITSLPTPTIAVAALVLSRSTAAAATAATSCVFPTMSSSVAVAMPSLSSAVRHFAEQSRQREDRDDGPVEEVTESEGDANADVSETKVRQLNMNKYKHICSNEYEMMIKLLTKQPLNALCLCGRYISPSELIHYILHHIEIITTTHYHSLTDRVLVMKIG